MRHRFVKVGDIYVCTSTHPTGWALRAFPDHKAYPPNFPGAPPDTQKPVTCFASGAQAAHFGYRVPNPPDGAVEVDGLYLASTTGAFRHSCKVAAEVVAFAVPCPHLLPTGFTGEIVQNLCAHGAHAPKGTPSAVTRCVTGIVTAPRQRSFGDWSFYLTDMDIGAPPGYVGIEIPGVSAPEAHLVIEAGPSDSEDAWGCDGVQVTGSTVVRGVRMSIARCPPGSQSESGHLMLTWSRSGVTYAVTLHGYTRLNLRILAVLTTHVALVAPSLRLVGPRVPLSTSRAEVAFV